MSIAFYKVTVPPSTHTFTCSTTRASLVSWAGACLFLQPTLNYTAHTSSKWKYRRRMDRRGMCSCKAKSLSLRLYKFISNIVCKLQQLNDRIILLWMMTICNVTFHSLFDYARAVRVIIRSLLITSAVSLIPHNTYTLCIEAGNSNANANEIESASDIVKLEMRVTM